MSVRIKEPVLWLGIGFSLAFAAKVIFLELQFVRRLMKVRPEEQNDERDDNRKGDAISSEALATLAESPTYESRAAALLVISERAARGQARKLLLKDLTNKSRTVRDRALTALHFIICNGIVARGNASEHFKRDPDTFAAIVECLCNLLPEHAEQDSSCPSRRAPRTRPPAEWKALRILDTVLQENVRAALDAGIVTRWLVNYPFAGSGYDDSSVVDLVSHCWSNDALMGSIINAIAADVQGLKQLRDADLISGGASEDKDEFHDEFDDEEQTDYYAIAGLKLAI
ncbi:hypothetical protein KEM55_001412 [Ascosphaera atra]|nr:hypothetical protein KEM55_001412 [Ascosphaera atra]